MLGNWEEVGDDLRIPRGTHTFELVEFKEKYTGKASYFILCSYIGKTFFGF